MVLSTTARKLTTHNPEQHPSMLQVATLLSDTANVAVERKALRFVQDTTEGDGENRRVKRQKFSVPYRVEHHASCPVRSC